MGAASEIWIGGYQRSGAFSTRRTFQSLLEQVRERHRLADEVTRERASSTLTCKRDCAGTTVKPRFFRRLSVTWPMRLSRRFRSHACRACSQDSFIEPSSANRVVSSRPCSGERGRSGRRFHRVAESPTSASVFPSMVCPTQATVTPALAGSVSTRVPSFLPQGARSPRVGPATGARRASSSCEMAPTRRHHGIGRQPRPFMADYPNVGLPGLQRRGNSFLGWRRKLTCPLRSPRTGTSSSTSASSPDERRLKLSWIGWHLCSAKLGRALK